MLVGRGQVEADGVLELTGAAVRPAIGALLGEPGEPALDLVDPGRLSRREVQVEARPTDERVLWVP